MANKEKLQKLYQEWQDASGEIIETAKDSKEATERAKVVDNEYKKKIKSFLKKQSTML